MFLAAAAAAAVLNSVTLTRTWPTQTAILTRPPSPFWLRQNGLIIKQPPHPLWILREYTLNERKWEEGGWGGEKKSKRTEEAEGEEGRAGGRQCLKRERERLSAAEYLTAAKQFDTLAPCYHPIIKIPHKGKHCDTSNAAYKHYITPPVRYVTLVILQPRLSASPCHCESGLSPQPPFDAPLSSALLLPPQTRQVKQLAENMSSNLAPDSLYY